jgi:hypothetical protein
VSGEEEGLFGEKFGGNGGNGGGAAATESKENAKKRLSRRNDFGERRR